jgi:hypothetical protein
MEDVSSSSSSASSSNDVPGAFAKRSRSHHEHGPGCFHDYVKDTPPNEVRDRGLCATAQLLQTIPASLERFKTKNGGGGTLEKPIHQAKVTVAQVLVPEAMATGEITGLDNALGRVLAKSSDASDIQSAVSFVKFGLEKRGGRSNAQMNHSLLEGEDTERNIRNDYFPRQDVYDFFHGNGKTPDSTEYIELDKSKRKMWKHGKKFTLGNEEITLHCQPRFRRATLKTLADEFYESETYAR